MPYLDLGPLLAKASAPQDWLFVDRIHLTDAGYDLGEIPLAAALRSFGFGIALMRLSPIGGRRVRRRPRRYTWRARSARGPRAPPCVWRAGGAWGGRRGRA